MSSTVMPAFRSRDARALISWLENTLGFTARAVHEHDGQVGHAELVHGSAGMVMVGQGGGDGDLDLDHTVGTQCIYVVVEDADLDGLWERARGGDVLRELRAEDYGGRSFAVRDPDGNVWSLGSYDPWAAGAAT